MHFLFRLTRLVAVVLLLAPVCKPLVAQSAMPLAPGDVVHIDVWRQPELSGEFLVASDGTLLHPIYKQVRVTDASTEEVENRIRAVLSRYEADPQFSIESLVRVAVEGEVRQPSLYTMPTGTSVAQAIALAGGATERGRLSQVRLYRSGDLQHVDLTGPADPLSSSSVWSGDRIVVARRAFVLRDYIGPIASLASAAAAIASLIINSRN